MNSKDIERRLRLPLTNLCLAVVGGQEGDLRDTKAEIIRQVELIVHDATRRETLAPRT